MPADIPALLADWSATEALNQPDGPDSVANLYLNLRRIQATVRQEFGTKGANIASATSIDIGAATGGFVDVTHSTGITAITALGTVSAGIRRTVRFVITGGSLSISHNATSLILPDNANMTLSNGAVLDFVSLGSGNWVCVGSVGGVGGSSAGSAARNIAINGDMRISQRATSFVNPTNGGYVLDRYRVNYAHSGAFTVSQSSDVPTVAQVGALLANSLDVTITSTDASLGATEFLAVEHRVEGYEWAPCAQRDFVVSFWARSSLTGTYSIACRNSASDRSYIAEYTINVANTWEYKSIVITASPTAGTWDYGNGCGLIMAWCFGTGATYASTPGTWQTGIFIGSTNQVNFVAGLNTFRVTGLRINQGTAPVPIVPLSYDDDLRKCMRYYQTSFGYNEVWYALAFGAHISTKQLLVPMRATPTSAKIGGITFNNSNEGPSNGTAVSNIAYYLYFQTASTGSSQAIATSTEGFAFTAEM